MIKIYGLLLLLEYFSLITQACYFDWINGTFIQINATTLQLTEREYKDVNVNEERLINKIGDLFHLQQKDIQTQGDLKESDPFSEWKMTKEKRSEQEQVSLMNSITNIDELYLADFLLKKSMEQKRLFAESQEEINTIDNFHHFYKKKIGKLDFWGIFSFPSLEDINKWTKETIEGEQGDWKEQDEDDGDDINTDINIFFKENDHEKRHGLEFVKIRDDINFSSYWFPRKKEKSIQRGQDTTWTPDHYGRIIRAVQFASLCYCSKDLIEKFLCRHKCKGPVDNSIFVMSFSASRTSTYGYIAVQPNEKSIIIAFRGSVSIKNWFNDFKFFTTKLKWKGTHTRAKVHRGFLYSYALVSQKIHDGLKDLLIKYPDFRIDLVGHSLGGALAVLCALDLKAQFLPSLNMSNQIRVITIGQPRVGNEYFAQYYDQEFPDPDDTYRVVNYADLIPHLPPSRLYYVHRVREIWILDDNSSTKICSSVEGEDPVCSNSIASRYLNSVYHMFAWNITFSGLC